MLPSPRKKYGFDARGVMVYEWVEVASTTTATSTDAWSYFRSPEDGARVVKGWFKVIAPNEDNTFLDYGDDTFAASHADDESEKWYYADSNGTLKVGSIEKIKGKYYGFRPDDGQKGGAMLTGLCALQVNDAGEIIRVWGEDIDSDDLDDVMDGVGDFEGFGENPDDTLYYFGNDADSDGAMKTGSTTISLDGDSYQFMFSKTGGVEGKGRGLTGIDDEKYIYKFGKKIKADSDEKYVVVKAVGDTGIAGAVVEEFNSKDIRSDKANAGINKDGDSVWYVDMTDAKYADCYLINTSGAIVKSKTAAKDGDDWYFYVDDKDIKMYTNNKTLKGDNDHVMTVDLTSWKNWVNK